jgi:hypothetical protein
MAVVCCIKEVPEIVAVTMLIELISLFFNRITWVLGPHIAYVTRDLSEPSQNDLLLWPNLSLVGHV